MRTDVHLALIASLSGNGVFLPTIDVYDAATSQWTSSPAAGELPAGVAYLAAAPLPNGVLFVGGTYGASHSL